MPPVQLTFDEIESGRIPQVCYACGAPSTGVEERTFRYLGGRLWNVFWFTVLVVPVFLPIVCPFVWRRMPKRRIPLPVCDRHRHHLLDQLLWMCAPTIVSGMFGIYFAGAIDELSGGHSLTEFTLAALSVAACGFGLGLMYAGFLFRRIAKCDRLTDQNIRLTGMHHRFVEAIREARLDEQYSLDDDDDLSLGWRRQEHVDRPRDQRTTFRASDDDGHLRLRQEE